MTTPSTTEFNKDAMTGTATALKQAATALESDLTKAIERVMQTADKEASLNTTGGPAPIYGDILNSISAASKQLIETKIPEITGTLNRDAETLTTTRDAATSAEDAATSQIDQQG